MNKNQKIIFTVVVLAIVAAAFLWSANNNSRGKYKAPYKYYEGDRPNFHK